MPLLAAVLGKKQQKTWQFVCTGCDTNIWDILGYHHMVQPPVIINQQDQQELVLQPLLLFHVEHER